MYLSGETSIFGIIGEPIQHSFSPAMQTVAFQKCNYNAVYLPFAVKKEKLFQVIPALETLNVSGINVTAPYKTEIIPYLTEISEEAKILQSVNTIYRKNEAWVGCSTDGAGFIKGLTEIDISPAGKSIQIIGAGGASQSIIYNLAKQGAQKIYISNRTYSKVLQTIQNYSRLFPKVEFVGGNCEQNIDLLVNTTSIDKHRWFFYVCAFGIDSKIQSSSRYYLPLRNSPAKKSKTVRKNNAGRSAYASLSGGFVF